MSDKNSESKWDAAQLANEMLGDAFNKDGKRVLGTDIVTNEVTDKVIDKGAEILTIIEAAVRARIDPVTGLLNRWVWEDEMNAIYKVAVRNNQPFTIVMMDVDKLKQINDTKGHAAGDLVLHEFGNAILNRFRASDICGRYGGDEMIAMLTNADLKPDQIAETENKMYKDLTQETGNGISVGIEIWDGTSTLEETIKRADTRLYQNKQNKYNA